MFENNVTIDQILKDNKRAVSTKKDGKVIFNIESIPQDDESSIELIARGEGSTVSSALNRALKQYASNNDLVDVSYVNMSRKKDQLMNEFLESGSLVVYNQGEGTEILYLKNDSNNGVNIETSDELIGICNRGLFCKDYTIVTGANFQKAYQLLSNLEKGLKNLSFEHSEKTA